MKQQRLLEIILSPHISEKATTRMEKNNEYVFRVETSASKSEIKDAVEHLFNTKVKEVTIVNVKSKQRMFRGVEGKKKGWKKAYVTLQSDQKLEIIEAQ